MKVLLAEDYGFCFGVERAVNTLFNALTSGKRKVVTDGDIVHNEGVMKKLINAGLVVDKKLMHHHADVFAIRAHGISPDKLTEVKKRFKEVLDLTCPIVKSLFKKAKELEKAGYLVVVFGKKGHAEMEALKGHLNQVIITKDPIKLSKYVDRVAVVSQTTSSWVEFSEFLEKIVRENFHVKEWQVLNTVCGVTVGREREVENLSKVCDLIIVVGGKHSANTGKLYRIASRYTKALWISSPDELDVEGLEDVECAAVVSGTSTPKEDVEKVYRRLLGRGKDGRKENK